MNPEQKQIRTYFGGMVSLPGAPERQPSNESELIARIHAGDERAMAAVYDRYGPVVYSVALRILQNGAAAEDVLQEVFLQLWRTPVAFDAARGHLAPWLAVVARNRAIDALRKRRPEEELQEFVIEGVSQTEEQATTAVMVSRVREVVDSMAPEARTLLEMAFFEGLTHSEIAAKTGQPLGTVKTRVRAGLLYLRKHFTV
jgi:RNA polymerase sigma-70 factor (ECF subfamily)